MGVRSDSQCVKVGHPGTMAVVAPLRSSVVWMLLVFCSCCGTGRGRTVARTFGGLTLPPFIYGTEGWEGNVYFDNLSPSKAADFEWEIGMSHTPNNGTGRHDMGNFIVGTAKQQIERLTFVPKKAMITDVYFTVLDRDTASLMTRGKSMLLTTNRTAAAGEIASMLVIGDSLTSSGEHTAVLLDIAKNDTMGFKLIGTRGQSLTNRHEGRGGWTVADYATAGREAVFFTVTGVKNAPGGNPAMSSPEERYTIEGHGGAVWIVWDVKLDSAGTGVLGAACYPCPPQGTALPSTGVLLHSSSNNTTGDARITFTATASGSVNPFWNEGKLNVTHYLAANGFPTPTAVTIMLGDNDLSGCSTDNATDAAISGMIVNLRALVDALCDAGISSVGLVWQPSPGSQDGFGADYGVMGNSGPPMFSQTGVSTSYRMKRSMLRWWAAQVVLATTYGTDPNGPVTVVPVGLNVDTVHSMSLATMPANARSTVGDPQQLVTRVVNGVHPGAAGQAQIADGLWAWVKYQTSALLQ